MHLQVSSFKFTNKVASIHVSYLSVSFAACAPLWTGWGAVGLTWAYCIVMWLLADLAKVAMQFLFRKQEKTIKLCKQDDRKPPGWAKALDVPGEVAEKFMDGMENMAMVSLTHLAW